MKHKIAVVAMLAVGTGLTAGAFYPRKPAGEPVITTAPITRGAIVKNVSASGTLEAVTTVEVGTQVSGIIESLGADFNSIVRKGQVLARLEPSLFKSAVEQAQANLVRAEAEQQRLQVGLADAGVKLERAKQLSERQLIPATDLDAASVNRDSFEAQVRSAAAAVTQARASLRQAQVNLDKTIITSPIDGIVIARNVDVGQTVAASLQAPTLFVLAADLGQMQLSASIDESDVGQIAPGQQVTFTVDAYPEQRFNGTVAQVRLNPTVTSNVVTYAAIVTAPNPTLQLKPGMTASVTVEVARRDSVLRVPNAALRFQPPSELVAADTSGAARSARKGDAIWIQSDGAMRAVPVRIGVSDGVNTEIVEGQVSEGAAVVTRVALPGAASPTTTKAASSPLIPSPPWRR